MPVEPCSLMRRTTVSQSLEGLGVVWSVKHFTHYLYGHSCTVYTDHEALKSLLHTPHPSGKLARWGMALQELDLKIEYRPGSKNQKADTLSHYPLPSSMENSVEESTLPVIAAIATERAEPTLAERQRGNPYLMSVIA